MGRRRHIFLNTTTGEEMVLPVTPSSWSWSWGNDVALLTAEQLGDINLPGRPTRASPSISGFFPNHLYPFCEPEAVADPDSYMEWFKSAAQAGTILRYIVSETPINDLIIVASITPQGKTPNGDVDYTITLREYIAPVTTVIGEEVSETEREVEMEAITVSHTVVSGDNLSTLCKFYYGETSTTLCQRVASHNGIANINLIYVGQVIEFPPIDDLTATTVADAASQSLINGTTAGIIITLEVRGDAEDIGRTVVTYSTPEGITQTFSSRVAGTWSLNAVSGGEMKITRTTADGTGAFTSGRYILYQGAQQMAGSFTCTPTYSQTIVVQH